MDWTLSRRETRKYLFYATVKFIGKISVGKLYAFDKTKRKHREIRALNSEKRHICFTSVIDFVFCV